MVNRQSQCDYFNEIAYKWDKMVFHDAKIINRILRLANISENASILDIGTGTGVLVPYLLECKPKEIFAIDAAKNMIEIAKNKLSDAKVTYQVADIYDLSIDKRFDAVMIYSCYPHLQEKMRLFEKLYHLTSDEGYIVICHSESKEKINERHQLQINVQGDILYGAEEEATKMHPWFWVEETVEDDDIYFIKARRNRTI